MEEERRLAYVGLTRARNRLYLTHAATRATWGRGGFSVPSRFLMEIPPELMHGPRLVVQDDARTTTSGPTTSARATAMTCATSSDRAPARGWSAGARLGGLGTARHGRSGRAVAAGRRLHATPPARQRAG